MPSQFDPKCCSDIDAKGTKITRAQHDKKIIEKVHGDHKFMIMKCRDHKAMTTKILDLLHDYYP